MHLIGASAPVPSSCRGGVVAIGNLDGVHRGHQALLEVARREADRRTARLGVVTFEPHPRTFFRPDQPVFRLTPLPLKARLLAACAVDFLAVLTFDRALAGLDAESFVREWLVERLGVAHVVTGYDFHFGKGRKGSPDTMRELGQSLGFGVTVVEQVTDDDGMAPYSSSTVRNALRHGDVGAAAADLGYRWTVLGTVGAGDRRGRSIGFPTANIVLEPGVEPRRGIYAVRVREAADERRVWPGAGYFGDRPTFDTEVTVLEVYLLGFSGDLYGRELMVEFIDFIRPDRRFDSVDALRGQMDADCREIARRLQSLARNDPMAAYPLGRAQHDGKI